jgi:hypothetical protein
MRNIGNWNWGLREREASLSIPKTKLNAGKAESRKKIWKIHAICPDTCG